MPSFSSRFDLGDVPCAKLTHAQKEKKKPGTNLSVFLISSFLRCGEKILVDTPSIQRIFSFLVIISPSDTRNFLFVSRTCRKSAYLVFRFLLAKSFCSLFRRDNSRNKWNERRLLVPFNLGCHFVFFFRKSDYYLLLTSFRWWNYLFIWKIHWQCNANLYILLHVCLILRGWSGQESSLASMIRPRWIIRTTL